MYLNDKLVKEFVKKQDISGHEDEVMQFKCIREELDELNVEWVMNVNVPEDAEVGEMADVLVTLLVFAELRGYWNRLEDAFEEKMKVNVRKPVRKGKGMKAKKNE